MPDKGPVSKSKWSSVGLVSAGFLGALALGAAIHFGTGRRPEGQPVAASSASVLADDPAVSPPSPQSPILAVPTALDTIPIVVKPHNTVSTTDKAMSAAEQLRGGSCHLADMVATEVLAHSALQSFAFYPFNRFISHLSPGDDPKFLEGLNAWIADNPKSSLAYLIRAQYYTDTAWLIRGTDYARAVPAEHMRGFQAFLQKAAGDVRQSIALDPNIPWSYYLWVKVAAGLGDSAQIEQAFNAGVARFPAYYPLYQVKLNYLTPKWGGSTELMYSFVERYAGKAPATSPLKLLYLQLTVQQLSAGRAKCDNVAFVDRSACVDFYMNHLAYGGLKDNVAKALSVYKSSDPIQFSNAVWPILGDIVSDERGPPSASVTTVLELTAEAMGSDTQLIRQAGHNNYVIDDITARVWARLGNPVNVDQKFKEALDDIERTSFPSDDEKDVALAIVYDDMALDARTTSQYSKVIAYHDAANAIAGINHGGTQYLKCFALYKMGRFQEAVEECSQLIGSHRDVETGYYYRARAHEGLKEYEASLADFAPVAENSSTNYVRWGAVIEMEHVNALLSRYSTELEIFKKYPFVFDPVLQPPDDLALAYNNRCFAYMKVGELQKALDDCRTSLQYGHLPDAVHKEQELQQMLSARTN